jgi:hypothetical protein
MYKLKREVDYGENQVTLKADSLSSVQLSSVDHRVALAVLN